MRIEVVSGTGQGPTDLAAFDAAEYVMGVGDCNLIRMSSIIPPDSEVIALDGPTQIPINWGDRVYCIYAEAHTRSIDEEAWAGVGWFFLEEESKGIFCEHVGANKAEVERRIRDSLTSFMKIRNLEPNENLFHMKVAGITCTGQPVCALAMAVYRAVGWSEADPKRM